MPISILHLEKPKKSSAENLTMLHWHFRCSCHGKQGATCEILVFAYRRIVAKQCFDTTKLDCRYSLRGKTAIVIDKHNEYNLALWHYSIVWPLFEDKQISKSHKCRLVSHGCECSQGLGDKCWSGSAAFVTHLSLQHCRNTLQSARMCYSFFSHPEKSIRNDLLFSHKTRKMS